MRAWTLIKHGEPKAAFALRDHPDPQPGPGQLLIRCEGFGLNYADVMAARGLYREAPPLPSILGYEVVGRVEQCGEGTPNEFLGKRVVAMTRFGGYAELAITDHRACAIIPDGMPLGEAAALATQGCTAWYAARILCPLRKGERVLVHSAAGGVGQLLVQLAVHSGCEVFAVVGNKEKVSVVKAMGAAHAIDRSAEDYAQTIRSVLGDDRLDVSFNAVGGTSFKQDLSLIGSGGRLVLFGGAERGGIGLFGTLRFVWRMGILLPIFLMIHSRSLLGINMLRISEHKPEVIAECLHAVIAAHRTGVLRPHVHATYAASELPEAQLALASGRTMGKVVVKW
ncbi:MAG: zinc-binding dehydrogenase [Flavobacteriales bacterium]|nr:zinc-binding dehydrogenase [Flavobacteriales bacterium]